MIKQITVAECDICGATQKAKAVSDYRNGTDYTLPPGWMQSEANREFCICPECWKKLTKEDKGHA